MSLLSLLIDLLYKNKSNFTHKYKRVANVKIIHIISKINSIFYSDFFLLE